MVRIVYVWPMTDWMVTNVYYETLILLQFYGVFLHYIGPTTVYEGPATRAGKCVLFFDLVVADALRKSQL